MPYTPLTEAEVRDLAMRLYRQEIFCNISLTRQSDIAMVFLPLLFMSAEQLQELRDNDQVFYWAEMKDALPRGINGYPMFTTMHHCSGADAERIRLHYKKIHEAMDLLN